MRVLVCGGRDFGDIKLFEETMAAVDRDHGISCVIQGVAKGADAMAYDWAVRNRRVCMNYVAEWKKYGNSAGAIRNQRMISDGKPDLVVAFPGGRGTADMKRRARSHGISVIEAGI